MKLYALIAQRETDHPSATVDYPIIGAWTSKQEVLDLLETPKYKYDPANLKLIELEV